MTTLILNSTGLPMGIVPLSVLPWEEAIKLFYLERADVVAEYDDWVIHSPSMEMNVPSIMMVRQYYDVSRAVKLSRENILLRDEYTCQYCGNEHFNNPRLLTMDHVIPRYSGGESSWENLATACNSCNIKKGHKSGYKPMCTPVKPSYYKLVNNRKKYPIVVPDKNWIDYLDWPEELITVNKRMRS